MAKPLKIILILIGSVIGLFVVAAIALPMLFDPNDFRGKISQAVQDETGREFKVGDIGLKVFPWLRVDVADAELGNAKGFGDQPFARVAHLGVGVKLMPLIFDRQVQVSELVLDGMQLNLAKDAKGHSNWDDLAAGKEAPAEKPQETPESGSSAIDLKDIDIDGVTISNAVVRYTDKQAGAAYRIEPFSLETGSLTPGQPVDVKLKADAFDDAQKLEANIDVSGRVTPDLDAKRYSIDNLLAQLKAKGASIPGGEQNVKLSASKAQFNADQGSLQLDKAVAEVAGIAISTQLTGEGLTGDHPKLSGPITVAPFSPRDVLKALDVDIQTADSNVLKTASLKANYSGGFSSANLDNLVLKLDDTTVQGKVAVTDFATQAIKFALKADAIDADRYLPPKSEADQSTSDESGGDINDTQLPTEMLNKLNATGTLDVASLKVSGVKMTDIRLKMSGDGKAPKVQDLSAKLYGGNVSLNNRYVPGQTKPSYALKTDLNALSAAPFLKDLLGKELVSGLGNLHLDLTSSGTTVGDLRKALNGEVAFKVENGAVKGFNLGQILRKGQALLAGQAAPSETEPQETDFATLSATAKIVNGVLSSDDLSAASPAFRMAGSGKIDLVNETINYIAKPTVVESKEGQGGKGLDQLKGLTVPIKLTGSLFSPKYKLDIESALKDKAKSRVEDAVKQKLNIPEGSDSKQELQNKLNEKLGDLLFGKKKKKKPDAEQTTDPQTTEQSEPAAGSPPSE